MSTRTTSENGRPSPFMDRNAIDRNFGGVIAWEYLSPKWLKGAKEVKAGAAAAAGATSVTVDALPIALPKGTQLNFGLRSNVTVTVASNAAQGATSISVNALSGPIPNGTILDFGSGAGLFALLTAAAAAGATSLTVEALPEAITSGKTATYTGGRKLAVLTSPAAKAATSVTVAALELAIDNDDVAYVGGTPGTARVDQYSICAKLSDGRYVPREDIPGSETAGYILMDEARQDSETAALSGFGFATAGQVLENMLPDAAADGTINSTWKTEMVTAGFKFFTYSDNR